MGARASTEMSFAERRAWMIARRWDELPRAYAGWPHQCRCGAMTWVKWRGRFYCYRCGRLNPAPNLHLRRGFGRDDGQHLSLREAVAAALAPRQPAPALTVQWERREESAEHWFGRAGEMQAVVEVREGSCRWLVVEGGEEVAAGERAETGPDACKAGLELLLRQRAATVGYTTWGTEAGCCGHVHATVAEAERCIAQQERATAKRRLGGTAYRSDRRVRALLATDNLQQYDARRGPGEELLGLWAKGDGV